MQKLLEDQKKLGARIPNAHTILLKKGRKTVTLGTIQSRLTTLDNNVNKFREDDEKIHSFDITAFKNYSYFTKDFPKQIEEAYCEVMGKLI